MLQTWRWFGPEDAVTLEDAKQAGASGIVTALHHMNTGGPWPVDEVQKRRRQIEAAGWNGQLSRASGSAKKSKRAPATSARGSTTTRP